MISVIVMQLQYAFSYYALESFKERSRTYVKFILKLLICYSKFFKKPRVPENIEKLYKTSL